MRLLPVLLPAILAAGLIALGLPVAARAATPAPDIARLRCAAAIALGAAAQARGDPAMAGMTPLAIRGRRFFTRVGQEATDSTGQTAEAIGALVAAQARAITASGDLAGAVRACLPMLDAAEPPHPAEPVHCTALLDVYAQVLRRRDPADRLAAALAEESATLSRRVAATPEARTAAQAQVRAALTAGNSDSDDLAACRALAAGH